MTDVAKPPGALERRSVARPDGRRRGPAAPGRAGRSCWPAWTPDGPTRDGSTRRAARPGASSTTPARRSRPGSGCGRPRSASCRAVRSRCRRRSRASGTRHADAVCGRSPVRSSTRRCWCPLARWRRPRMTRACSRRWRSTTPDGCRLDAWGAALDVPGTVVAALQSANGEVGTRQPLGAAWEAGRARGIPLVVDAQAGLGARPGSGGLRRAGRRRSVVGWAGRGRGARRPGADPVASSRSGERGRVRTDRRRAGGPAGAGGGGGVAGDGR